jgi:hypothetical protein
MGCSTSGHLFMPYMKRCQCGATTRIGLSPSEIAEQVPGFSLLDCFAASVLPAVYTASVTLGREVALSSEQTFIAKEAYELADAMLAERERSSK